LVRQNRDGKSAFTGRILDKKLSARREDFPKKGDFSPSMLWKSAKTSRLSKSSFQQSDPPYWEIGVFGQALNRFFQKG